MVFKEGVWYLKRAVWRACGIKVGVCVFKEGVWYLKRVCGI